MKKWTFDKQKPARWFNELKSKIVNFDIKPARPIIGDLWAEIERAEQDENFDLIDNNLRKILLINNTDPNALGYLATRHMKMNRFFSAIKLLKLAIKHYPDAYIFYRLLGDSYLRINKHKAAAKAYVRASSIDSSSAFLQHLMDSTLQNNTAIAPRDYVVSLFNDYAETFDDQLVQRLQYRSHMHVAKYLQRISKQQKFADVIDLGCGTGLLGQELCKQFQIENLQGVDLSAKMLQKCAVKNIYSKLHEADLIEFLQGTLLEFDVIASSDVLTYIGDLKPVLAQCYQRLKSGGYLGFSVEAKLWGKYKLSPNGRYLHSKRYIKTLAKELGFREIYCKKDFLRVERGMLVPGLLVVLQK